MDAHARTSDAPPARSGPAAGVPHSTLAASAKGAPPDFARLVQAEQERVARLASRLLGWSADVEDVVQEVFVKALAAWSKFRGDARVSTWLRTITVNACRSHQRRRRRWLRIWSPSSDQAIAAHAEPDVKREDAEQAQRVRHAVAALPAKYREVVVLRYLEELPADEIAAVLRISRNALDVRLNRARQSLKAVLADLLEDR